MVDVGATAAYVYRPYDNVGVPDENARHEPVKTEIIALWNDAGDAITALEANSGTPGLNFNTRALLYADLAHIANTVAFVNFDATTAYNGKYIKIGGSGAGSWSISPDNVDFRLRDFTAIKPDHFIPFADGIAGANTDFLRRFVRGVWAYGAIPGQIDLYLKSIDVQLTAGITYRAIIIFADALSGNEVAKETVIAELADMPSDWKLGDYGVTPSNLLIAVKFDWSNVTGVTVYTFAVGAGRIHPACYYGPNDCDDYLTDHRVHERLRVGPALNYADLDGAIDGLLDFQLTDVSGLTCGRAHYGHRIELFLETGGYQNFTVNGRVYDQAFPVSVGKFIPEFVQIRGAGKYKTAIIAFGATADAVLEWRRSGKIIDCTVFNGDRGGYCIHSDNDNNDAEGNDGIVINNRRILQLLENVELVGGPSSLSNLFGCGISSGQHIRMKNVSGGCLKQPYPGLLVSAHNTGQTQSVAPATLELIGCQNWDGNPYGVNVISLGGGNKCNVVMIDSPMGVVQLVSGNVSQYADQMPEWSVGGNPPFVVLNADGIGGIKVLSGKVGAVFTGTAKVQILGDVDELGRGNLAISEGVIYPPTFLEDVSLGARIGNAPGWTLTTNAKTHTFNYDATALSNAAIIALINANLTAPDSLSEVELQYQLPVPGNEMRMMKNITGATIAAGKIVERSGANNIVLADGAVKVMGVVVRDILNNGLGLVFAGKQLPTEYVPGASAQDGEFGVAAGVLSFAATDKVGFVDAGGIIVNWYR